MVVVAEVVEVVGQFMVEVVSMLVDMVMVVVVAKAVEVVEQFMVEVASMLVDMVVVVVKEVVQLVVVLVEEVVVVQLMEPKVSMLEPMVRRRWRPWRCIISWWGFLW